MWCLLKFETKLRIKTITLLRLRAALSLERVASWCTISVSPAVWKCFFICDPASRLETLRDSLRLPSSTPVSIFQFQLPSCNTIFLCRFQEIFLLCNFLSSSMFHWNFMEYRSPVDHHDLLWRRYLRVVSSILLTLRVNPFYLSTSFSCFVFRSFYFRPSLFHVRVNTYHPLTHFFHDLFLFISFVCVFFFDDFSFLTLNVQVIFLLETLTKEYPYCKYERTFSTERCRSWSWNVECILTHVVRTRPRNTSIALEMICLESSGFRSHVATQCAAFWWITRSQRTSSWLLSHVDRSRGPTRSFCYVLRNELRFSWRRIRCPQRTPLNWKTKSSDQTCNSDVLRSLFIWMELSSRLYCRMSSSISWSRSSRWNWNRASYEDRFDARYLVRRCFWNICIFDLCGRVSLEFWFTDHTLRLMDQTKVSKFNKSKNMCFSMCVLQT